MHPILQSIHNLDLKTFDWCLKLRYRDVTVRVARISSYSANGPFYVLAGAIFIAYGHWALVQILISGFIAERGFYFLFKAYFKRNRPPQAIPGYRSVIEPSDQFSFPSGHTSAAFLVCWAIVFVYPSSVWLMLPWATSVGISRVILGVHFPTDTLAGAALGSCICLTMIQFV